jgi:epoxide hydrolase-like predicted phosphatase
LTIRAVLFDFGGVLYHLPDRSWIRRWKRVLNLKDESVLLTMIASPQESKLLMDILEGNLPEEEMWNQFAVEFRVRPELMQRIRRGFMSKRRINQQLVKYLASLRDHYITAILSNAGSEARRLFTDVFQFHHIVDEMIISAEERVAKPDRRIYEIAMEKLAIQPHQAIFVDDFPENIQAANDFGMHGVLFKDNNQVILEVNQLLNTLR